MATIKAIRLTLFLSAVFFTLNAYSQQPVKWSYSSKKISDKVYEVQMTAQIDQPWHIYSQSTPEGGPLPTKISFNQNPMLEIDGEAKENGNLVQKHEEVFGVDVKYYAGQVTFVQTVAIKKKAKTNITGKIEYMACTDERCLPPATVSLSVPIK